MACSLPGPTLFAAETYTIGVGDYEYYPYHSFSKMEYRGFAKDILELFAETYDLNFQYRPLPWKRVVHENIEGDLDFVFPDHPFWDTDAKKGRKVYYSSPVVEYVDGVMVLPENRGKGIDHLQNLGTISGFTPWDYMDMIQSGTIRLFENSKFVPLLKQVLSKRIDGAYIEISVAKYNLRKKLGKPGALVFDPGLPHTRDFYYLSTVKHPQLLQTFNYFLINQKETIEQLRKQYNIGLP